MATMTSPRPWTDGSTLTSWHMASPEGKSSTSCWFTFCVRTSVDPPRGGMSDLLPVLVLALEAVSTRERLFEGSEAATSSPPSASRSMNA